MARQQFRSRVYLALSLLLTALFGAVALDKYPFWDDEAGTALFARNILTVGSRSGWDGHNLVAFHGGIDLDQHLVQSEASPLQFYVVAASFRLLGARTWTGRLPMLIAGIAALGLLYGFTRRFFDGAVPPWLPALLLAANVSYGMYITQCRYYGLVMLFSAALLLAWSVAIGGAGRCGLALLGGAGAALALFETNYMDGVALLAGCGVGLLHPRLRPRSAVAFLLLAGCIIAGGMLYVMASSDALDQLDLRQAQIPLWKRVAVLMRLQLTGLGTFEFVPLLPSLLLCLPFLLKRLEPWRPVVWRTLVLLGAALVVLFVVAATSPQDLHGATLADMRYVLPVMILGAVATSATIAILSAAAGRWAGAALLLLIVFSNLAYLGPDATRCTLCDRLTELAQSHPSGTDALLEAARPLPAGASVAVSPSYMTLQLMFYRPDLRYPGVLDADKRIDPSVRASLPPWVFCCDNPPQTYLVGIETPPISDTVSWRGGSTLFRLSRTIPLFWKDETRPELPWHRFHADPSKDREMGVAVFRRQDYAIQP